MRKIVGDLRSWGDFIIKHMYHAEEYGESVLHRYSEYLCKTDSPPASDKILCPDMPSKMQKLHINVNRLVFPQRAAVTLYYCAPIKEDGNPYTLSELAKLVKMNKGRFRAELRKGIDSLERMKR